MSKAKQAGVEGDRKREEDERVRKGKAAQKAHAKKTRKTEKKANKARKPYAEIVFGKPTKSNLEKTL